MIAADATDRPIVIVGAGLAGGNAAVTLRDEGFDGRIVLIGREPGVPFGRPPLSKTYLRSEEDLEFQKLLIATGAINRRFNAPGAELPGIHQLRTVAECDAIKDDPVAGRHAVVAGMGFIGCEVAASLTQLGVRVTTVFGGQVPLEKVLGLQVGGAFAAIHEEHGVELLSAEKVVGFEGGDRVEAVVTASGRRLGCDFVILGIGIEPVAPPVRRGRDPAIQRRAHRRAVPDERARHLRGRRRGDHPSPAVWPVRVEHYNNAEQQGRAAAKSMLGATDPFDYVYSFWSDQYEHSLEYAGYATRWDDFVIRGSLEERALVGFYLVDGALAAAVGLNRGGDPELDADSEMAAADKLVAQRARLTAAQLANETFDLWSAVSRRASPVSPA